MPSAMEGPPPNMSQDDMRAMIDNLGVCLNLIILQSLLHGLYTGIVAVTLWTTYTSTKRAHNTFLRTIIILLYLLSTMAFAISWAFESRAFIQYGYNYYSVFSAFTDDGPWWSACYLISSITGGINTILVDVTLIWRCWELWGHQWWVILLPMMCAVVGTVMKGMQTYSDIHVLHLSDTNALNDYVAQIDWPLIYSLMTLATNLMCTLFIVYRIVRFATIFSFRNVISAMIQSSAIYSLAMIVYLFLLGGICWPQVMQTSSWGTGIAPTFLMLRVAAGSTASSDESAHSRPLSDINFRPIGGDTSSSNPSDQSVSESHGTRTTESV
ncbi:hypothetical protein EDD18DRAFT_1106986 [Armillaria luteobubalina]|uniref:Uncharacterized protein n=1 Tax=Armillaria luteobubalina TaxID=153913 RepID=A0AA39Q275_9AGAR|nr:hypothetical protein EDD18DRAFT_1106986 [Armillaria luteobubalina]